jgi:hypothetical protein
MIKGLITVRLSTSDPTQAGAIAMSTVQQDIERSDILAVTAAGDSGPAQVFGPGVTFVSQPVDIVTLLDIRKIKKKLIILSRLTTLINLFQQFKSF